MTDHIERKHALFSPSGSKQWLNCPGSVKLRKEKSEALKDDDAGEAAKKGTIQHEICEWAITVYKKWHKEK